MKWFRCLIEGENFPGELIGDHKRIGFYTTRFIRANSPQDAELAAISLLKVDKKLQPPEGVTRSEIAKVYVEEIEEVSTGEVPEGQPGYSFFSMDE